MRVYTVHLRQTGGDERPDPLRDLMLVKEGFSWPAFLFTALWALSRGLWLTALVLIIVQGGLAWAAEELGLDPALRLVLSVTIAVVVGSWGNDLRRRRLARRGFELVDVAAGPNTEGAELAFLRGNSHLVSRMGS